MIDKLKKEVLKKAGEFMGSPAALNVLSNPTFQNAMKRAINLRADVRDSWERQLEALAKSLNLVTRGDVKTLKRRCRELENQIATLEHDLKQQKVRADKAEKAASAAQAEADGLAKQLKEAGAAKKEPAKQEPAKKEPAKKEPAKKEPAKEAAKKAPAKKAAPKKAAPKKKAAAKKTDATKKAPAKKKAAKKKAAKKK